MVIEIKAPTFPESVTDGTVTTRHKEPGRAVKRDGLIVDIETDKVIIEALVEADGVLAKIIKNEGDTILSSKLFDKLDEDGTAAPAAPTAAASATAPAAQAAAPVATSSDDAILFPTARKLTEETSVGPNSIANTGKDSHVTKEDVVATVEARKNIPVIPAKPVTSAAETRTFAAGSRVEERVPVTRLRAKITGCLVEAQSVMAVLTTFNEVNMKPIMDLHSGYEDLFGERHNGVRPGLMSLFVKVVTEALKRFPGINVSIGGNDIIYRDYQDIGVAVSNGRGLVALVLHNAEFMSLVEIEGGIVNFGKKAEEDKLTIEDVTGGTFTVSNGDMFDSLLSTPTINPP